jgi:hypothetical protein
MFLEIHFKLHASSSGLHYLHSVDKWVEGRVACEVIILYDNYIFHFWRLLRSASWPSAFWATYLG